MPKHNPHAPAQGEESTELYRSFGASFGKAMNGYQHQVLRAVANWQQEVARFVALRAEHDRQAAQAVAKCDTLPDFLQLQQSWAREAAADYLEEVRRLQALSVQITRAAWTPVGTTPAAGENGP